MLNCLTFTSVFADTTASMVLSTKTQASAESSESVVSTSTEIPGRVLCL